MDRRIFIASLASGLVSAPYCARAQQPAIPAIGLLRNRPSAPFANIVEALRQGLKENGLVEGQNVLIEQRWADNQLDRLPGLAAELVGLHVGVIVTNDGLVAKQSHRDHSNRVRDQ